MRRTPDFKWLLKVLGDAFMVLPDSRQPGKVQYGLRDAGLAAFSVFVTQSPSFLSYQRSLALKDGSSNANRIFGLFEIPSDTHIRELLDGVDPQGLYPAFREAHKLMRASGMLADYRLPRGGYLVILDGTDYFTSKKIHCMKCSTAKRNDVVTYSHSAITPVIAHPSQSEVLSLEPSFITPQDGHEKQDCELRAAGRWLDWSAAHYELAGSILQGDDLYARQPWCERVTAAGYHYLFVCKPSSHKTLTEYLSLYPPEELLDRVWHKGHWELRHYRFINGVPLRDGADALLTNWFEVTITNEKTGKQTYMNSFITDLEINAGNVAELVSWGRCRWKIENENNNTLKTKGYNFEHNYGHGSQFLSSVLLTQILYAFLVHTILSLTPGPYKQVRAALVRRDTFFDDVRALLRYRKFRSWDHLLTFMMKNLGLTPTLDTS